ncbi:MAG TPA: winged helix-turn-helix domain-containing protein [Pyrinomonadaceae bacterium]|nr:winged helix-turn-helix domain-containing protein [Pyrinomonadaceae bacterium]
MTKESPHFYEFGPFKLDPDAPFLLCADRPVSLTVKALKTLVVLVESGGRVVSREEFIETVWPDVAVEENNLSVNISLLRKALGDREDGEQYIETVPRRGYRFTAPVREVPAESAQLMYARPTRSPTPVEDIQMQLDPSAGAARALSIGVLPFNQIGNRVDEEYLGIGLCDTLITRLSNVRRFVMRPTSSVVRYSEGKTEPLAAGRDLKVDFVVDGRIRRAGETFRVSVQLLKVSEEAIFWAGQFDEKFTDVLQLEDSIAEQVAIALVPQMTADERERLAKRGTDNPEAFEAYLRGRFHFNSLTEDGYAKALADYERAVLLDPAYALAYTGIADFYYHLAVHGVMPSNQCLEASEAAARRAVEIDPDLAEAHAALGFALSGRFKWAEGERHVLRALDLSPNSALAHLRYGNHLVQQGFVEEAVQHARRSLELDPLSPIYQFSLGWGLYFARRFDESLEQYQTMIAAHPLNPMSHFGLAWVARHLGRHDEALSAMKSAEQLSNGSLMMTTGRGTAYAAAGMRREAEEVLENIAALPRERYVIPYHVALIHHFLGDREKTLLALEEAFEQRDLWLVWIGVEPVFDNLRSDARFQRLLKMAALDQKN